MALAALAPGLACLCFARQGCVRADPRSYTASRREADANKACGKRSEPHPNLAAKPSSPLKTRAKKN